MRPFSKFAECEDTMQAIASFKGVVTLMLSDTVAEFDAAFEAMPTTTLSPDYDPVKSRVELKAYMVALMEHWLPALKAKQ